MITKRKFVELYVFNGLLIWLGVVAAIIALFAQYMVLIPVFILSGIGVILLTISKWRLWKEGHFKSFGYGKMTKFEKTIYLAGHLFIALAIFGAAWTYFTYRLP